MISIIIPIYNIAKYLNQCLDSIVNQSYSEFEALLIDDGSSDESGAIAKKYANLDSRFKYYRFDNQGLGKARNEGLSRANGEYVCFVDSDDCLHSDFLSTLYEAICGEQFDVVYCDYIKFTDDDELLDNKAELSVVAKDISELWLDLFTTGYGNKSEPIVVVWNKLYRRELLDGISFESTIHEDEFFTNKYLPKCRNIGYVEGRLYYYRQRTGSIMNSQFDERNLDVLEAYRQRIGLVFLMDNRKMKQASVYSFLENITIMYHEILSGDVFQRSREYLIGEYKRVLSEKKEYLSGKQKIRFQVFLMSKRLFYILYWREF